MQKVAHSQEETLGRAFCPPHTPPTHAGPLPPGREGLPFSPGQVPAWALLPADPCPCEDLFHPPVLGSPSSSPWPAVGGGWISDVSKACPQGCNGDSQRLPPSPLPFHRRDNRGPEATFDLRCPSHPGSGTWTLGSAAASDWEASGGGGGGGGGSNQNPRGPASLPLPLGSHQGLKCKWFRAKATERSHQGMTALGFRTGWRTKAHW